MAGLLGDLEYPADASSVEVRLRRLDAEHEACLLAIVDGRPVGTATLHVMAQLHRDTGIAQISSMIVTPSMRGHGIGERLMQAAEQEAVKRGCDRVELVTGMRRRGAHAFYEHLGYVEQSHRARRYLRMLEHEPG